MKYFDVSWAESESQMVEQARLFGTILSWAANRELLSDAQAKYSADMIARIKTRSVDGDQFFANICFTLCDGKICDHDFGDVGKAFMSHYIEKNLQLFSDDFYQAHGEILPANDSWETYDKLSLVFEQRFNEWRVNASRTS